MNFLSRFFSPADPEPAPRRKRDWRTKALEKAAERYAKPFKCGATNMPREVFRGKEKVIADSPEIPQPSPKLVTVADFKQKAGGAK